MSITLTALQKQRRDTAANWTTANPTLLAGEIGLESDTGYWKVGDGSTAWTSLAYVPGLGAEIPVSRLADGTARQLLQTAANGNDVEWTSNVDVPGTLDVTGAATFDSSVTVQGDLTVNGTTTTIDTQHLIVEDKNVVIGQVTTPTDVTADGGGITLKGSTDKTINWVDSTDAWTFSEHINIASAKEYRINGIKVLDATSLGSGVVSSSLTSVGTIATGTWQGTAIADTYLATISTAGKVSNSATTATSANTASAIVARDGSGNFSAGTITANLSGNASTVTTNANLTGDVTSVGNATSIAAGVIVNADVNASAAIAGTKISPDFGSQNTITTGTSTAASFIPTSSTAPTNGVYLPAANSVAISTNGSGRLFVDSSGRVGVGTSSPQLSIGAVGGIVLHLAGTGTTGLRVQNTSGNSVDIYAGTDGFINASGGATLNLQTGGTTRATLTSTGLGIGSTPVYKLDVTGGNGDAVRYLDSVNSVQNLLGAYNSAGMIGTASNHPIYFQVNSSEKARIDTSGRFLVGTSNARTNVFRASSSFTAPIQIDSVTNSYSNGINILNYSLSGFSGILTLGMSKSNTQGTNAIVGNNDELGGINFVGNDGTNFRTAALIEAQVDGTPGTNDMPGRLVFSTTADGASSPTERMRLAQNGALFCPGVYNITTASSANVAVGAGGDIVRFTSSAKYKTDVENLQDSYADALLNCRPVWYRSTSEIDNSEWSWWGFIAEEVAEIDPRLVHWKTIEVTYDENGSAVQTPCTPEPDGVQYDRFVPHLLNLIKRQKAQIEAMEARLSALEAQ